MSTSDEDGGGGDGRTEKDPDSDTETAGALERFPTGIAGLDAILCGGFFRGGVYMVLARPGAGKTILGNQICFGHVASGGQALFVTVLAESHGRLLAHLQSLAFFEPSCIGRSLSYLAAYQTLEKEKLEGLAGLLRRAVHEHRASLLVVDGIVTAGNVAESELELKKFIHEVQIFSQLVGCTTLLLTGPSEKASGQYALRTMADGLLEMHLDSVGMEGVRSIEVSKLRGSRILQGRHILDIGRAGVTIYPRTEALYGKAMERPDPTRSPLARFGIEGLDAMLGGGLQAGSITMVLGSPGSGKTLLGLGLLADGARQREPEPGLYFGFFETPSDLCRKGEAVGIGLAEHVRSGRIVILWQSPLDAIADALAEKLLADVRARGVKRVVIDGLGGFKESLFNADRARRFFGALCGELRALGVVTVLSDEAPSVPAIESPHGLTAMLDNIVLLRHVEVGGKLQKLIRVSKMREGAGDPSVHEFTIGARGFVVSAASEGAQAALAGGPHLTAERGGDPEPERR